MAIPVIRVLNFLSFAVYARMNTAVIVVIR